MKEEKEPKYDIKEDDDPKIYNNKHPELTINQDYATSNKKIKKSKTVVMPKKYEKAKPKVYDAEEAEDEEDEEEKPVKVPAIVQKMVRRIPNHSR